MCVTYHEMFKCRSKAGSVIHYGGSWRNSCGEGWCEKGNTECKIGCWPRRLCDWILHLVTAVCLALVFNSLFLFIFTISLSLQCAFVWLCTCKCQSTDWRSVLGYNVGCNQTKHSSPTYTISGETWMVGLLQQFPSALNLPAWIWPYAIWALWGLRTPPPLDRSRGGPKLPQEDQTFPRTTAFDKTVTITSSGLQTPLD